MRLVFSTAAGRIFLSSVVALILVGATFLGEMSGAPDGDGLLVWLFIVFLGAIIAIQVVPGMLLFGAIVRALATLTRRETVKESKSHDHQP